ncbi:MAG: MBOAT family protein [Lachnospiraceae bacterium]|nr:MBOAT family protein [Lachnospiraceae bacterium]
MVFSSLTFLLYFLPITISVYFLLGFSIKLQNTWLLIASLFFYAWGEPVYVLILIASVIINYILGLFIGKYKDKNKSVAKVFMVIDVVVNISILFVFKYMGFFVGIINGIIGFELLVVPQIVLPIGISFFTFQALSYAVEVYRGDANVQKNPFYMGLYVAFFPQLVAGPIVRYKTIAEYINSRKFNIDTFSDGVCRFAVGLIKKVLVSNTIAVVVDKIYLLTETGADLYSVSVVMAWTGAIGYMLQIYYDFSAYSDMAIGLGKVFGFEFEENFNYPYISKGIGEFWRRWHISLGTWFKEYVYFPLGGSRVDNQDFMVRNTFIVWFLTGLWHGASWTFILWGLYNMIFILVERLLGFEKWKNYFGLKYLYSNLIVLFGWVLFRAESLYVIREFFANMFGVNGNKFVDATSIMILKEYWMVYIPAIIFSAPIAKMLRTKLLNHDRLIVRGTCKVAYVLLLALGITVTMLCLIRGGYNPFIYFNF